MTEYLLALNCGSSSFKFKLFEIPSLSVAASGQASAIGTEKAALKINDDKHELEKTESHHEIFQDVIKGLHKVIGDQIRITTITHRIVHGANEKQPMVITKDHQEGLKLMDQLSSFAPLHNHHAVLVVRSALEILPKAKNVLCFDTLFHQTLPQEVKTYAIGKPEIDTPIPLQKYGFHGLSYASILKSTAKYLRKEISQTSLIICHLGSGASMCCIKNGKSIDTSMGLTPLEGLPGGTRSGTVDPSLVFHLFGQSEAAKDVSTKGITASKGEFALNKNAGFQGMTGTTDFKEISDKAAQGSKPHQLALKVFENRILHFLGAYLLLLKNKPDAIIFSGGIGEKSAELRKDVVQELDYLDLKLDNTKTEHDSEEVVYEISGKQSAIKVLRVLTDEELQCAEMAQEL